VRRRRRGSRGMRNNVADDTSRKEGDGTSEVDPSDGKPAVLKEDLPPIRHQDIEISFEETGQYHVPPGEALQVKEPPAEKAPAPVRVEDTEEYQRLLFEKSALADQILRTRADFDNARKRIEREKAEFQIYANMQLALDLLPFLDNLERALDHADHVGSSEFVDGIRLIYKQVMNVLARYGVTPIDAVNTPFDPNLHQAMGFLETTEIAEGCVAQEILKGYMIRDRLLRAAVVRVARPPEGGAGPESPAAPPASSD